MNLMQLASDFRSHIPSQRRAHHRRAQEIEARLIIPHHERKVFWYVLKQNFQGVLCSDILLRTENVVLQDVFIHQREVLRISGTDESQNRLHEFFAGQF